MPIEKGDRIKIEYEGTLEDGTVFDSSAKHGEPLEFEVGAGRVLKGFEEALVGMEKDEEKEFTVEPADGYGDHNPELTRDIPKDQIPQEEELKVGMVLVMSLPNGFQISANITEVTDENVKIDLNHPLAGKPLNFKVKVLEIYS